MTDEPVDPAHEFEFAAGDPRWLNAAIHGGVLALPYAFAVVGALLSWSVSGVVPLILCSALLSFLLWLDAPLVDERGPWVAASVALERDALVLSSSDGARRIPRTEIESVSNVQRTLAIRLRDGARIGIRQGVGEPLSQALVRIGQVIATDLEGPARRYPSARPWYFRAMIALLMPVATFVGACGLFLALHPEGVAPGQDFVIAAASAVVVALFALMPWTRSQVVVGQDGIAVEGLLSQRFIAHGQIERVERTAPHITHLHVRGGARVAIREAPYGPPPRPPQRQNASHLGDRVEAAHRAHAAAESPSEAELPTVVLGQKPDLGDFRYRDRSLPADELERALTDTRLSPGRRVGAALALAQQQEQARRVRIACERMAGPAMQRALAAAAEGEVDETALREALRRHAK